MTREEMSWRGWSELDVLLISGDAYVDHPSFGVACLGRWLESLGARVGIIAQPRWNTTEDLLRMGVPRLFVGISSGTVDSMINNYTANRKRRSDDMYAAGGKGGLRPDYASVVYSGLARQAFPNTTLVVGGVEASLRRLAHFDFWQNKVRPSILMDLQSDLLAFGMGERSSAAIFKELSRAREEAGTPVLVKGHPAAQAALTRLKQERGFAYLVSKADARELQPRLTLPSFEEVRDDKKKFARAAYLTEFEASPANGRRLVQYHGSRAVVVNPPPLPLSTSELDAIYELPFVKDQHPSYDARIPACDMIRFSVASNRGCFGGCSFCAITLHQGRIVQSRSEKSILQEVAGLQRVNGYKGIVTDVGGPTANMYGLTCKSPEIQAKCRKLSCVSPTLCPHLQKDHSPQIRLLSRVRATPGVRKVFIACGLRYDLALGDQKAGREYLRELVTHHVGGHLKVAPEHLDPEVLALMKKPPIQQFEEFAALFDEISRAAGKEQYLVPYFISGFPGSTHEKMQHVTSYLQSKGWRLQQVQAFIPTPMTLATAMYWTGLNPVNRKALFVAKSWEDRKIQQALLQPHRSGHKRVLHGFRGKKPY